MPGTLERLARGRMAAGSWQAAIEAGRRWLDLDPLHEPAHRLLMSVLARSGEQAAAIRQYRDCVRILYAELGVAPLPETTELYEAIRAGRVASDGSGGTPAPALDGREPDGQSSLSPFVGRDRDLAALTATIHEIGRDGRLLVIEGEPGIGKTRLAAALGDRVRATGATVLEARAYAGETAIPFGPVAELIRAGLDRPGSTALLRSVRSDLLAEASRLVPLPGVEAPAASSSDPFGRTRLLEALADLLTALVAGPAPGTLLLDDAHLADASTIEMVAYLARRLRGRPIVLLLTWRPEELANQDRDRILSTPHRERLRPTGDPGSLQSGRRRRARHGRHRTRSHGGVRRHAPRRIGRVAPLRRRGARGTRPIHGHDPPRRPGPPAGANRSRRRRGRPGRHGCGSLGRSFALETVRLASGRSEDETIEGLEELVRRGSSERSCARSAGQSRARSSTTSRTAGCVTSRTSRSALPDAGSSTVVPRRPWRSRATWP